MAATLTLKAEPYRPSSPITGEESSCIYRGKNVLLAGKLGQNYYRSYAGSLNIGENYTAVALTGTITYTTASTTITGSGTSFLDELHLGQLVIASNGEPLEVTQLVSQTSFIAGRLPSADGTSLSATIPPRLEAMDVYRIAMQWGNAILTDRGNILAVGSGEMYRNGAVLSGSSLTATRTAQLAIYTSSTGNYAIKSLGYTATPTIANTAITVVASGGTKNTSPGYYSFQVGYYSDVTNGYSDGGATKLSGGTAGYNITAANSTFNFNFSADSGLRPVNSTGYVVYATAFTNSKDQSFINATQGPWYECIRIPFSSLTSNQYAFDYIDADLSNFVSYDNDPPPNADWIASLAGYVNLVSCAGQGVDSSGRTTSTSPGPFVFPMKANNIEAYPASYAVPTEKGENIIGQVSANGRLFLLTANTLQATTPTGLDAAPMTIRPFWKLGFANPGNLTFVNDTLYGFTGKGPYRSIATGDSAEATNDFASSVNAQMAEWPGGYVYVTYDPKNRCICYFYTASHKNDADYWCSTVYVYSLDIYDWLCPIILSDDTRDMIVSGCCVVQNSLYFIAGGRRSATTDRWDTFSWDTPTGTDVPYYLAFNYIDVGAEFISKILRKVRAKGLFRNGATVQVYGVTPGGAIDIADLETGDNPLYEFSVDASPDIVQDVIAKLRIRNILMWTLRLEGVSNASVVTECDQFHELSVMYDVAGQER